MRAAILVPMTLALATGCYASHGTGSDAGPRRDARVIAPDAGGPVDDVVCEDGMPRVFPSFDRSCMRAESCFVAIHQTDCCGSHRALGIASSERARFEAAEARCRAETPACMCASRPTLADDGSEAFSDEAAVACLDGTCTTSFADD